MSRTRTRCKPIGLGLLASSAEDTLLGSVQVSARMHLQDAAIGLVQPRQHDDLVAYGNAVHAGLNLRSKIRYASGAPSSPCRGASAAEVSGLSTRPIADSEVDH